MILNFFYNTAPAKIIFLCPECKNTLKPMVFLPFCFGLEQFVDKSTGFECFLNSSTIKPMVFFAFLNSSTIKLMVFWIGLLAMCPHPSCSHRCLPSLLLRRLIILFLPLFLRFLLLLLARPSPSSHSSPRLPLPPPFTSNLFLICFDLLILFSEFKTWMSCLFSYTNYKLNLQLSLVHALGPNLVLWLLLHLL